MAHYHALQHPYPNFTHQVSGNDDDDNGNDNSDTIL